MSQDILQALDLSSFHRCSHCWGDTWFTFNRT